MIEIKEGKFFYRLIAERKKEHKYDLLNFLNQKKVNLSELQKIEDVDFEKAENKTIDIKSKDFDLTIKFKDKVNVYLFGTTMDSLQFGEYVEPLFK